MNKKNKVLLSTVGLLLLSGIAATSSTFAWFTTVRQASVMYSSATVEDKAGSLAIVFKSSLNSDLVDDTDVDSPNEVVLTGAHKVTDISGDGLAFHKPIWADQTVGDEEATQIDVLPVADEGDADGYFIDFTVTVSRTNYSATDDGPGLKVYLGAGTAITPTDATDDAGIVEATRLAVINADGEVVVRWAPVAEAAATAKYLAADATGDAYETDTHKLVTESGAPWRNGVAFETLAVHTGGVLVADLGAGVESADITFRAWIEGEDAQTTNQGPDSIVGKMFDVNIDLYALQIV